MMKLTFKITVTLLVGILATSNLIAQKSPQKKPNIVLIMADDLGYGDIGTFGAKDIRTPNIDKLAENGLKFTSFYSTSPVCSPSRFGLLTGRYPRRQGIDGVFFPESFNGIPKEELTLAEALKTKGYSTGIVGKWHLGHHREFLPLQNGFDEYFGIPYSNDMQATVYLRGNDVVQYNIDQRYTTKTYTEEAIKFIDKHKKEPFFLYLPHTMPHLPLYASPAFEGKSKRGLYGDVIEELDWSVGQVIESLKKNGLEENTLVIFTSDNGPWTIFDIEGGSAGKLRNGKGTTFEGGQRVPTVFQWPAKIKAGSIYEDLALHLDIFPTILKLADYQAPLDNPIDGEDISPILTSNGKRKGDEFIYYSNGKIEAFRKGDWKIRLAQPASKNYLSGETIPATEAFLFNLKDDVGETKNLYAINPEKVAELLAALDKKAKTIGTNVASLPQRLPADDVHIKNYFKRHPEQKKSL